MHGLGHGSLGRSPCLPQQQIDDHGDAEEGSADGRVPAQEEDEVAEQAEQDHPHHVQLEEQVENVEPASHRAQVLHVGGKACPQGREMTVPIKRSSFITN